MYFCILYFTLFVHDFYSYMNFKKNMANSYLTHDLIAKLLLYNEIISIFQRLQLNISPFFAFVFLFNFCLWHYLLQVQVGLDLVECTTKGQPFLLGFWGLNLCLQVTVTVPELKQFWKLKYICVHLWYWMWQKKDARYKT